MKNKVQFVTFNYDNSLEFHLRRSLEAIDLLQKEDVDRFFEGRIIHVYGDITKNAPNPNDLDEVRSSEFIISSRHGSVSLNDLVPFEKFLNRCVSAAAGIRTIDPHDKADESSLCFAKTWLMNASVIYILGYGFDENNNHRVGLTDLFVTKDRAPKSVMFTNLNDLNTVNKRAGIAFGKSHDTFLDGKASWGGFLRGDYIEKSVRNVYGALEMDFDAIETRSMEDRARGFFE